MRNQDGSNERVIYQAMAEAFWAEGVHTQFLLTGHGQMHWAIALAEMPGVKTINVRHEHASVAMATGYHYATGKVGVASTTCGPGFTQITTALTSAVQARVPLVILTADSPLGRRWYNQAADQEMLTKATGAHYISAHSPKLMMDYVQEAFYVAQFERRPVVLSVPYDLFDLPALETNAYVPSREVLPDFGRMPPDPDYAERAAHALAQAQTPVIIGGRGAVWSGAAAAIETLAQKCGALLGNTLPARGLFDHNQFSLGVIGGYASEFARVTLAKADCVMSFGASLTQFTTGSGQLFKNAKVIQVDAYPRGFNHGRRVADMYVRADAKVAAEAITERLAGKSLRASIRTPETAKKIAEDPIDSRRFEIDKGTLDPRAAIATLDRLIPKDWDIVGGTGANAYFYTHMKGRDPRNFQVQREFGAIGSGLSMAIGVAVSRGNGKIVLIEGDGGFIMHIQELETIRRHGIKLLMVVMNDGGFGAEFHTLRPMGKDDSLTFFGRPDFPAMATGFGLSGATVTELDQLEPAFKSYDPNLQAKVIDLHISDKVSLPSTALPAHYFHT